MSLPSIYIMFILRSNMPAGENSYIRRCMPQFWQVLYTESLGQVKIRVSLCRRVARLIVAAQLLHIHALLSHHSRCPALRARRRCRRWSRGLSLLVPQLTLIRSPRQPQDAAGHREASIYCCSKTTGL